MINLGGITFAFRAMEETSATEAAVAKAFVALREVYELDIMVAELNELPASFPTFQWHDDTFTLPEGAVRLAESPAAANQAFRIGRAAYGIQFHFEADRDMVRSWSETFAAWLAESQPGWAARMQEEAALHGPQSDETGLTLARAWVAAIEAR